jgi:transposase
MKGFYLEAEELVELRLAHKSEHYKRSAYKINAIILLGSGWKLKRVKEALLLDDETLRNYVMRYREGGLAGLIATNHKGSVSPLTEEQSEALIKELDGAIYLTTQSVIDYVENEFGLRYQPSGMRDLLHRLGYEYKKPKLVPGNPDIEAQELFAEQYEEFMLNKPADVEVLFGDAVHPEHNGMAAYGWIKRGEKRELKTNSGRQRLNLHGAMNAETYQVTVIESKTVNSDSTLELFQTVESAYPAASRIMMILDNARYHYSKEVQAYLEGSRIEIVFLPSYSPNLNLIERLWKFFKKKVLYNHYYKDLASFRKACIHFFSHIENWRAEMISFIGSDFELV